MHKENPEELETIAKLQSLDKRYKELLSLTSKMAMYKQKADSSAKDLERSVSFMRSALFAMQSQFTNLTDKVSASIRCCLMIG
jgi:hypothetical protein